MKKYLIITTLAAVCVAVPAWGAGLSQLSNGCPQNENAQVTVSFNGTDKDVSVVKTKLDAKIQEVKTLAEQQHFTKFDVQSNNYNINANYNSGYGSEPQFQYSGSASFSILPADKAVDFMVLLTKKGYQASVNVNSYNNGNCGQALEK